MEVVLTWDYLGGKTESVGKEDPSRLSFLVELEELDIIFILK